MLARPQIAALIPHQGAMCLLDTAVRWDATTILCTARSHLDPSNPLREHGRLGVACGIEYGLQAAALHGALSDGVPQPPGYLAGLRDVTFGAERLDDPNLGVLAVSALLERREAGGLIYGFRIAAESGRVLIDGRATIVLGVGA